MTFQNVRITSRTDFFAITPNVGGMVSCGLRASFLSNYTKLQAGGNA